MGRRADHPAVLSDGNPRYLLLLGSQFLGQDCDDETHEATALKQNRVC